MFRNTAGGHHTDNDSKTIYTFPKNAVFEINGVSIPLGGMTVECYGRGFDGDSIGHFTNVASSIIPHKQDIYNTSIFISDQDIRKDGYPSPKDFLKNGMEYISPADLRTYQEKVLDQGLPRDHLNKIVVFVTKEWQAGNRQRILREIQAVVEENQKFPKNISIIYDDRGLKHTSHIVLSFETPDKCVLHIDNTLSPFFTFNSQHLKISTHETINPYECLEKIKNDESRFIELYNAEEKLCASLEFSLPVNEMFITKHYKRMKEMLESIGLKIKDVKIHHSLHNQKDTYECVPYAIQNKLDYVADTKGQPNEAARQQGIRLRAEHAILSYLFSGNTCIPRNEDKHALDRGIKHDVSTWYPNFPEVCMKLDESIKSLSFTELRRLYLSIELDDTNKISEKFAELLLSAMKVKLPADEYTVITGSNFDKNRASLVEKIMAPNVFYNEKQRSLFTLKGLMFSVELLQGENVNSKHGTENSDGVGEIKRNLK